jgi:hypothetical protein
MQIESFANAPLPEIIKSYLYWQYSDDITLQAFVDAYNSLSQGYRQWFLDNPLSVYTLPGINGPLLDWIGQGVYGIVRPVISWNVDSTFPYLQPTPLNTQQFNSSVFNPLPYPKTKIVSRVVSRQASDDIYKRVMTWALYLGDGKQCTITWVKRRIARFLYGVNGGDITVDEVQNVSISTQQPHRQWGPWNMGTFGSVLFNNPYQWVVSTYPPYIVALPNLPISQTFLGFIGQGVLQLPSQINFRFEITTGLGLGFEPLGVGGLGD